MGWILSQYKKVSGFIWILCLLKISLKDLQNLLKQKRKQLLVNLVLLKIPKIFLLPEWFLGQNLF